MNVMGLDATGLILIICLFGFALLITAIFYDWMSGSSAPQESIKGRFEKLSRIQEELKNELPGLNEDREKKKESLFSRIDLRPFLARYTGEAYFQKIDLDLVQAGFGGLKVSEFLIIRGIITVIIMFICALVSKNLIVGLVIGLPAWFLNVPIFMFLKSKRVTTFSNQLSPFLILVVNSLRAGQTFMQGADIASKESPDPIAVEFRQVIKEVNLGLPVEQSMDNMLLRVPCEDLKIVVAAYTIQRKVGGNLATILETTAETIRDRIRIQGQIDVLTTQGKLSGLVVGGLPFAIAGIMCVLRPEMMFPFFTDIVGKILIGIAFVLLLFGILTIWKIISIDI